MTKILIITQVVLILSACHRRVGPTEIRVEDPSRHYFPIVLGEKMDMAYKLVNVGAQPFITTDIQPSCGCISIEDEKKNDKKSRGILSPGDSVLMRFQFDGSKNIGYVHHTIRIYGNVKPDGVLALDFDVNVVPPANYVPDYEETYEEKRKVENDFVDGKNSQRGYTVD